VILFAPFAARAPSLKGQPSPKDYPFPKELVSLIGEDNIVQVGGTDDEQIVPDFRKRTSRFVTWATSSYNPRQGSVLIHSFSITIGILVGGLLFYFLSQIP
jgi:hypothetical protein